LEILERLVQLIKKSNFPESKKEYSLLQLRGPGKDDMIPGLLVAGRNHNDLPGRSYPAIT
jgi:hypothetical protein